MTPDDKTIEAVKAENGPGLALIECDGVGVIVKPVEMGVYRLFKKQVSDDDTKAMAGENLFYAVLVWPKRDVFQETIKGRPFLIEQFAGEVVKAAGSKAQATAKKL